MNIACEAFMDYSYGGEIATEMMNPITETGSLIERILSVLQRLVNNFRKLRNITVPTAALNLFVSINKEMNKGGQFMNGSFTNLNFKDPKNADEVATAAQNLDNIVDNIENSNAFKGFMAMPAKDSSLKASQYSEANSGDAVSILNNDIRFMARFRAISKSTLNTKQIDQDVRKSLNSAVRFLKLRIKVYNKLLAFRKSSNEKSGEEFRLRKVD